MVDFRTGGADVRAVPAPAVLLLPATAAGGARWVAPLSCGDVGRPHRAWFDVDEGAGLGLAVLHGKAHVAFGPKAGNGGVWPGLPEDFAPADGAWLRRRGEVV